MTDIIDMPKAKYVVPAERAIQIQSEAAKKLIAQLHETHAGDDDALVSDMIEGETSLLEAIEAALSEIDECEVIIAGLKAKETEFEARRKMTENRVDRIRAVIEQAMLTTNQLSMRLTTATITLAKRKPSLIVTSEADIPSSFWIEQERPAPKLDKKSLSEALAAKNEIPGAMLDNGSYGLTIRRK